MNLKKITRKGKSLMLAYDQGLEHGPTDFNNKNVDPEYVINIANKGKYNAFICQKGIAEKYRKLIRVPLVIKLNGKTRLVNGDPISNQLCSIDEAVRLKASAVGYTIYIGSEHESEMLDEFADIVDKAHKKKLPVIAWIYPRGKSVRGLSKAKLMAYAARTGLEVGADIVKLHVSGGRNDLEWAVKAAGRTKIVVAGGIKKSEKDLIKQVKEFMNTGIIGFAIGRNVWQAEDPLGITKKLKKEVFGKCGLF